MASSDYPYDDIDDFFSSPVKICSIKIDKKDIDEVPLRAIDYYARQMNDWDWPMSLDLKAKEDKLYVTLTGKAQSIEEIEPYLCDCASYGFIVNKALRDQGSVIFYGSLNIRDFIKLFEINMRHERRYLGDEQLNALYKEFIIRGDEQNVRLSAHALSDWLEKTLDRSRAYKYCEMYILEEEFLKEKGLLNEDPVLKQKEFLRDKSLDYYRLEVEADYLREFMIASKKNGIHRSEVKLLRDTLDGCELKEPNQTAKLFKDIFSKRKSSDLELEF